MTETKERILEAAHGILSDEGPAALTTRRVCEAVGVTMPTLYHYFASRDELVKAVHALALQQFMEKKRSLKLTDDPLADLRKSCELVLDFVSENKKSLSEGMRGANVVVHAAASLTSGMRYRDHERTNVEGTRTVLACARRASARRFIYVSAASVVVDADRPTHGDETLPVVHHRSMPYSATKGLAERVVLEDNDSAMSTIALRPPFIWGEGAPAIGRIAQAFNDGSFVWIGGGGFAYSVCHVDNLANAVVRSVDHGQGGKAYFITDDDMTSMRRFFTDVIEATGQPAKAQVVPYWFASVLARMVALAFSVFRPGKQPPLTLETVRMIGHRLELSNALAKRELGYAPTVSREAGVSRLRAVAANGGVAGGVFV